MKKIIGGAVVLCMLAAASCKKHDHDSDPADVSTTISAPAPGQVFNVGDTVNIQATVHYDGELHGYQVTAVDSANNTERWNSGTQHAHSSDFSISQHWVPGADAVGAVKIAVVVAIDHEGTEARKEVAIRIQP